jgi:hypothetical protein
MSVDTLVPCLVCGSRLDSVPDSPMQPYGGLMCRTYGNFGSRVYDMAFEPTGGHLAFIVCDECAVERHQRFLQAEIVSPQLATTTYEAWGYTAA